MNQLREKILCELGVLPSELNRLISTASHRYKVFYIPKKSTGQLREIAQPAQELKAVQSWLVSYLSRHLPVHDCAVAYRIERGIKHNALCHAGKRFVLKMDMENFFPSIAQKDIEKHFSIYGGNEFSAADIYDICKIVLWAPKNRPGRYLCIGAPSSPFLSNSILYNLDSAIDGFCRAHEVTYTRYADDLIFSTNRENVLTAIEQFIYQVLDETDYPKLSVNKAKTVHTSKGRGVTVTGVVITPDGKLSIGRDRKRLIRASIHHFLNQKLSFDETQKLNGLLAFSQDIEPEFIQGMKLKYGEDILYQIRSYLAQNNSLKER